MIRTALVIATVALALLAGNSVEAASSCAPAVFRSAGTYAPARMTGPALVLSGGGLMGMPYESVLAWMRRHVAVRPGVRAGNLLILKASGGRDYSDLFYTHSRLASIREILIPPCASRASVDNMAGYVERADAVLFAGGDQSHYTAWKGSRLIAAVRGVYARGGIVGGGSAGLAIQGQVIFDSAAADRVFGDRDVATPDAVANPYEPAISFTTNFFHWPALTGAITDTHFARRDRFGRLASFMSRALRDGLLRGPQAFGVAVDEGAVLLVNANGTATLVERRREDDGYLPQGAYILRTTRARRIAPDEPLLVTVDVTHIEKPGTSYNLVARQGSGARYRVTVDGTRPTRPYSRDPYR